MRSQSRSTRMWSIMVASLCVLWFATPAGAIPLESWDDIIPSGTTRFKVLSEFGGEAVLDKNTGLVWEKAPNDVPFVWGGATRFCADRIVGGQKGWRLPAFPELSSLIDPSVAAPGPLLPPGHPFLRVQSAAYWSASTAAEGPQFAWNVFFDFGNVFATSKILSLNVWCVRGPMQESVY